MEMPAPKREASHTEVPRNRARQWSLATTPVGCSLEARTDVSLPSRRGFVSGPIITWTTCGASEPDGRMGCSWRRDPATRLPRARRALGCRAGGRERRVEDGDLLFVAGKDTLPISCRYARHSSSVVLPANRTAMMGRRESSMVMLTRGESRTFGSLVDDATCRSDVAWRASGGWPSVAPLLARPF